MAGEGRNKNTPRIAILGFGNWGTSFAHALRGAAIPPDEVVATSEAARRGKIRGFPVTSLKMARLEAQIFWLCVPDSAIERVTHRLVEEMESRLAGKRQNALEGRIVVHSSGALSSGVLAEAARAGASIASVHPMMTFPRRVPVALAGTPFGIEAEARIRGKLNRIVHCLGGNPFRLDGSTKVFYHAAATLASPFLTSLFEAILETSALAGLQARQARLLMEPIALATLKNVFTRGAAHSFSGPIARGDAATIHLHLQALETHPMLRDVYRSLALYAVESLPARNRKELRRVLREPIAAPPTRGRMRN